MPTNNVINPFRLAAANSAPLMTQEQLTNTIVMLTEQIIKMQEDMIILAEENQQILETVKNLLQRK